MLKQIFASESLRKHTSDSCLASGTIMLIFGESNEWIGVLVTTALLVIILAILFRIEWKQVFDKYAVERGERES